MKKQTIVSQQPQSKEKPTAIDKNWHHSYIPSHNEFLGNLKLLLQIKLTHQQRYSKLSLQMISCNTRIESMYYEKLKRSHNFGTRKAFYYFI